MTKTCLVADDAMVPAVVEALTAGFVVVFPSANTYGLLASGEDPDAIAKIYDLKGRDRGKPLGYISSRTHAGALGELDDMSTRAIALWPGPLSIILPKKEVVPEYVTPLPSVLLVCPDQSTVDVVDAAPIAIACTSANLSGDPAITTFEQAKATFDGKVALLVDGGTSKHGVNGSIVDFSKPVPTVLRIGGYPLADLRKHIPELVLAEVLI